MQNALFLIVPPGDPAVTGDVEKLADSIFLFASWSLSFRRASPDYQPFR